jgi:transposase
MDIYGGKMRALDLFWSRVKNESSGKSVGILYGACGRSMNPTGRGELSVPVRQVLYRCQRVFPTVLIPENNTTKCCAQCGCHLRKLYSANDAKGCLLPFQIKKKGIKKVEIRGLRLCMNRGCSLWSDRSCPYVDRDLNAAVNIFVAAMAREELAYLRQGEIVTI